MENKKLARRVTVAGTSYGPGPVPADVAKKIKNPKAWMSTQEQDAADAAMPSDAGTTSGHRLVSTVNVEGRRYGPTDHIPADVAAKIRNPKAWEGGRLPGSSDVTSIDDDPDADTTPPEPEPGAGADTAAESGADTAPETPPDTAPVTPPPDDKSRGKAAQTGKPKG